MAMYHFSASFLYRNTRYSLLAPIMSLFTSAILFTLFLAFLLSYTAHADNMTIDHCWCYSDNMVGYARALNYYNKRANKTHHWLDSCADQRDKEHYLRDFMCLDAAVQATCTSLPDVTKYQCGHKAFSKICHRERNGFDFCVDEETVYLGYEQTPIPWTYRKGAIKSSVFGERFNYNEPIIESESLQNEWYEHSFDMGTHCGVLCDLVFGPNEQHSAGLKPLCEATYLQPGKYHGLVVPITYIKGRWFGKLMPNWKDKRACKFYNIERMRDMGKKPKRAVDV